MCGIAGYYRYRTSSGFDQGSIRKMLESIRYRGPDHMGLHSERELIMGGVRLSIMDVSEAANQPVFNEDGGVVVFYNGEIYNHLELKKELKSKGHVFATSSDTEVLVHLYEEEGLDFVEKLNGMFAFALYDRNARRLVLGRDRAGQKPLYVRRSNDGILFCSELRAMIPWLERARVNRTALLQYLSLGYALEPETIVDGVETLEPGSLLVVDGSGERAVNYWTPNVDADRRLTGQRSWEEEAEAVFSRTLKRLVRSDVPVTMFLSGGVDSSLLATYAREGGRVAKAYIGSFVDDVGYDEYPYAREIGRACGIEVERVELSRRMLAASIEPLVTDAALPPGDTSTPATFCLAREVSKRFKVVIGGDGGDELFGGYPTYWLPELMRLCWIVPRGMVHLAHVVARRLSKSEGYMPLSFRLQQLSQAWQLPLCDAHFQIKNFLPATLAPAVLDAGLMPPETDLYAVPRRFRLLFESCAEEDDVKRQLRTDVGTFLLSGCLPKMERQCMRFSLENRLPFLDNEVIDLSLRTDSRLMVSRFRTKACLRRLLKKRLGGGMRCNPIKQGFTPSVTALLSDELRGWRKEWLSHKSAFFSDDLEKKLDHWRSTGWDTHRLEWHICSLKHWCHANGVDMA